MHERVANLLGVTALHVTQLTDAEIRSVEGISSSASAALVVLAEAGDLTVTELSRRIGLSQPAAVRMVDTLQSHGLVVRRPSTGRAVPVGLTETGRRAVTQVLARRGAVLQELVGALDGDEQAALSGLLAKVLGVVHRRVLLAGQTPHERIGEFLCRLCDRTACREDGAPCPVTAAQHATGADPRTACAP